MYLICLKEEKHCENGNKFDPKYSVDYLWYFNIAYLTGFGEPQKKRSSSFRFIKPKHQI